MTHMLPQRKHGKQQKVRGAMVPTGTPSMEVTGAPRYMSLRVLFTSQRYPQMRVKSVREIERRRGCVAAAVRAQGLTLEICSRDEM